MASSTNIDVPHQNKASSGLPTIAITVSSSHSKLIDTYGNVFEIPDYTISDIYNAIPKHCYKRSTVKGLYYVFRDVASMATTFYFFNTYITPENVPSTLLRAVLWSLYTFIQGLFGLGAWVLGHECGHQTLSTSKTLNDTVGFIIHSALLAPYFSWKISHRRHHKAAGNLEEDVVWNPKTRQQYTAQYGKMAHSLFEIGEETPIVTFGWLIVQQLVGWPNHLLTNVTSHEFLGRPNGLSTGVNHFNPGSPLFDPKDAKYILISDLGMAVAISLFTYLGNTFGWANMLVWYFVPYLWVNHWLACITFLQHTDPSLPRYTPNSWTYVRGAAATIDRSFGFIGRHLFHGIIETHVLHHYVPTIPFYHAWEASEAIKKVMGHHYRSDTKGGSLGFISALWRNMRWCQWVEPPEGDRGDILFYRNLNGLGIKPVEMSPDVSSHT
ncbi:hypothetical protein M434DRAFT_22118 [Hypoxylon sp. CO27-5]|nr:hypothetical protein M434DRAFT_22118 [Hypoxylon sp. CO27-5]